MKSLRDVMQSMKKASKAEVDNTSASLSKAGPSKQPDLTTTRTSHPTWASDHSDAQPMDTDVYGPPLPPKFTQSAQSDPASKHLDLESDHHSDPHSAMLPLNPILKDAYEKFEQDFLASNLPEGKYIKPPASTAKYYKVGQPCFEDKIQELNTDFAKIPLQVLKELEHQARQNLSTINFTATFAKAKTASSCNTVMEKCQHSIKATFKRVKSQIQNVPILKSCQACL